MEGVFWNIIRHQIVETIKQEPSHESLLILLKLGDPSITDADVDDETKRSSAFRKLKRLIHPDKHQDDSKCTKLFQDAQAFFESSIKELYCRPKKKPKCSHSSSSFPSSFHVEEKWPWLSEGGRKPIVSVSDFVSTETLQKVMAFKCINFRGAIAYGRKTELTFGSPDVCKSNGKTAEEVFQAWGGSKRLESIEEIKEEISTNGPVVSSSFRLSKAFLETGEHRSQFEPKLANNGFHPLLLVGWKVSRQGEMWLVRSFVGKSDILIPIGQFDIEENVVGPTKNNDCLSGISNIYSHPPSGPTAPPNLYSHLPLGSVPSSYYPMQSPYYASQPTLYQMMPGYLQYQQMSFYPGYSQVMALRQRMVSYPPFGIPFGPGPLLPLPTVGNSPPPNVGYPPPHTTGYPTHPPPPMG